MDLPSLFAAIELLHEDNQQASTDVEISIRSRQIEALQLQAEALVDGPVQNMQQAEQGSFARRASLIQYTLGLSPTGRAAFRESRNPVDPDAMDIIRKEPPWDEPPHDIHSDELMELLNDPIDSIFAPRVDTPSQYECIACTNSFPLKGLLSLDCGHRYCRACLHRMFNDSLAATSTFPVQCCSKPIAITAAMPFLSADLVQKYEAKEIEHNTENKIYCSNSICGMFIPPGFASPDETYCPACNTATCSKCKAKAHWGTCSDDPAVGQVLELARENGWQQCPRCKSMVELIAGGCNHMMFVDPHSPCQIILTSESAVVGAVLGFAITADSKAVHAVSINVIASLRALLPVWARTTIRSVPHRAAAIEELALANISHVHRHLGETEVSKVSQRGVQTIKQISGSIIVVVVEGKDQDSPTLDYRVRTVAIM
ncbi:ATP-dependent RNA helicase DEAH11-like protein [Lachnellula suecica]|uniref:RBR-type E3 ubiquitin transferase n=1 Tax=Lachnellula suecica TaxID=602035 RepID=A0A8T9C3N2_9HELO|nr:ATP-dependent RNA helicase DEAH11-like protein [Lachnellula suecica]